MSERLTQTACPWCDNPELDRQTWQTANGPAYIASCPWCGSSSPMADSPDELTAILTTRRATEPWDGSTADERAEG